MSLGEQIKNYRLALGLKLEHLAELSDVAPGTISALTVRGSDRSKYAAPLAKGLGLTLEELLDPGVKHLVKSFDHVAQHRPHGWEPSADLSLQIAHLRGTPIAREPTLQEVTSSKARSGIVWPFRLVSYARIDRVRRHFEGKGMPPAIAEIDRYLDALVSRWEAEMQTKRSSG